MYSVSTLTAPDGTAYYTGQRVFIDGQPYTISEILVDSQRRLYTVNTTSGTAHTELAEYFTETFKPVLFIDIESTRYYQGDWCEFKGIAVRTKEIHYCTNHTPQVHYEVDAPMLAKWEFATAKEFLEAVKPPNHELIGLKTCPDCNGVGRIELFTTIEDPCKTCHGRGKA